MAFQDGGGGRRVEPLFDVPADLEEDEPVESKKPRSSRRGQLLGALVALAGVAGFVGIAWYATNQGEKGSPAVVPEIKADKSPIKILPAKPGGADVPNQDKLIFMQIDPDEKKAKAERLLPPPEKPMPKPAPPPEAQKTPPPAPAKPKTESFLSKAPTPPEPASRQAKALPKTPPEKPEIAEAPAVPGKAAPESKGQELASAPDVKPEPSAAKGAYLVQLGAFRAEDIAAKAAKRIEARHKSILAGLTVKAVRADLGKRGIYYRLRAGPLADKAAAADLCEKLKARRQGCMVVNP